MRRRIVISVILLVSVVLTGTGAVAHLTFLRPTCALRARRASAPAWSRPAPA
ncbi:hypothetical protein ACIA8R_33505 [Nonomuraea sp. NPDC051191]|uniref:hypothetical protein n=1 Tax=Nonomuraea sp. NPDC051191 TaxID=3364372 RepID=UPI0037B73900